MVFSLIAFLGGLVSCSEEPSQPLIGDIGTAPTVQPPSNFPTARAFIGDQVQKMNAKLEAQGADYRIGKAEWMVTEGHVEAAGIYVYFNDRGNKQLSSDWVPFDPRRGGTDYISYIVDATEGATSSGLTAAQTTAAIDRAMRTWNRTPCAPPILHPENPSAVDLGVVQYLNGLGGSPTWVADYTHAGWLPAGILPSYVIGVTYTFIWTSGGVPTDIDNNKATDTAFRETYYNDAFFWRINANMDVETIALHEAGHGLSQGHFGGAFTTDANGGLHFNPRALMNAAYSGVNQEITETDLGGHCSIWADWPNN